MSFKINIQLKYYIYKNLINLYQYDCIHFNTYIELIFIVVETVVVVEDKIINSDKDNAKVSFLLITVAILLCKLKFKTPYLRKLFESGPDIYYMVSI